MTDHRPSDTDASTLEKGQMLPALNVDLRQHKLAIALNWAPIVLFSGVLPIVGYFALHYGTTLDNSTALAPWLALMGASSLFSLGMRLWSLTKKTSDSRPLGQTNVWGLDFFTWNFIFGFVVLTGLISAGSSTGILRIVAIPLAILMLYVCLELLLAGLGAAYGYKAPFRFSSVNKGETLRGGCYVIIEDVVAVEGKQGRAFRQAWSDRYEASPQLRAHMVQMDLAWSITGLSVVVAIIVIAFAVDDAKIGYAVGWGLPWIWAGCMTFFTINATKRMLRRESARM